MSTEFAACLETLKNSQKDSYRPWSHPILEEFKDQILAAPDNEVEDHVGDGELDDSEVVVGQVTKSFKCPITRRFYERPVTSKNCNHSYSQDAIQEHIKRRCVCMCVRACVCACMHVSNTCYSMLAE